MKKPVIHLIKNLVRALEKSKIARNVIKHKKKPNVFVSHKKKLKKAYNDNKMQGLRDYIKDQDPSLLALIEIPEKKSKLEAHETT